MVDSITVPEALSNVYGVLQVIVILFWAYLLHSFVESFFINAFMLDSMQNLRRRALAFALVSGLSFGLLMTGGMFLSAIPVSIWSFALLILIGMVSGYRLARRSE